STVYRQADFPEFRFVRWYEKAVDVLPATGSKYETISILAEQKGYEHEDIITVGDGNNDFEMIQKSGYGIAMANGEPRVKEVATLSPTQLRIMESIKLLKD